MVNAPEANDFYVYAHRRGDTGDIFYVGKGRGRRAHYRHGRNELWTRIAGKHGFSACILHDHLTEEQAFEAERLAIAAYRPVANFTDGGEGISGYRHTREAREAIRSAHAGRKQAPSAVEARSVKLRGQKRSPETMAQWVAPMTGKRHSAETRERMSAAHMGLSRSADAINRTADWHRGRKRDAQARTRMSEAQPKRRVTSLTIGQQFASITEAAAWLRSTGHPKATKAGVWAACKRAGTYLGHAWAYADGPA